jgi:hypothetical protein
VPLRYGQAGITRSANPNSAPALAWFRAQT